MRVISAKLWVRVLSLALVFLPCQLVGQKSSAPEWEDPAVFERNQEPLPFEDIVGPRYPTPDALEQLAREPKEKDNRPSFMDEYCAATSNSLGHFQEFWDLIYTSTAG